MRPGTTRSPSSSELPAPSVARSSSPRRIPPWRSSLTPPRPWRRGSSFPSFCRRLMSAVGYRGVVNIGGKYDHRDGLYKVMDVNARVGASFRLCGSDSGFDVVRVLYLYMTGQRVPVVRAQVGRRWLLEEDLLSAWTYVRNRELTFPQWLQSMRGVDECAWWARSDPLPFVIWSLSSIWSALSTARTRPLPAPSHAGVSEASAGIVTSEPDASQWPRPGGSPPVP